ncbi:beta-lactamase/transpeptidase-like protein [Cutaneotrichosporon oleaginosum]|uniref:Beta-lactamase/transpeptidase-like protein n=1 Tax=Cutaneotrichosporon oleaginosum TaxID=879819 RepID=A0A0J1AYK5_9TREE|nr:beta-lactamase/transpeptidase-like protein [Cutaneotrichosporon oleaginosum]KLT40389.1 beta-lactamase/transpeptidase-like protein [Cutaneotrichosporon oleaginosum]TXT11355.1 hypothetical protein COLE_01765 [Cutaneotrichosporon oleaginosum]
MTITTEVIPKPVVSTKGKVALDDLLTQRVDSGLIPAATFAATTADGPIYFAAHGERVLGEPDAGQIDDKTMLQFYSMTKLVTSVAVLQLVDRGLIDLDDPEVVEKHCPELCALPVLTGQDGDELLSEPRTQPLTVRRLLTHTSGLAYSFTSPLLAAWHAQNSPPPHYGEKTTKGFEEPMVFQPGERWLYSIGIDWAGILVERISGLTLQDYFHEHIFRPLCLTVDDVTFIPNDDVRARMQKICRRLPDGSLETAEPMRPLDLSADTIGQLSGGGGLHGTARAYLRFLQGVLNRADGIVSEAGYAELFADSLRGASSAVKKGLGVMTNRVGYHDPEHTANDAQHLGHSVGLVLSLKDSVNGRREGSGCWDGAAKTHYWLDPATGIAGICFTQLIAPSGDPWLRVYNEFERTLYDALE